MREILQLKYLHPLIKTPTMRDKASKSLMYHLSGPALPTSTFNQSRTQQENLQRGNSIQKIPVNFKKYKSQNKMKLCSLKILKKIMPFRALNPKSKTPSKKPLTQSSHSSQSNLQRNQFNSLNLLNSFQIRIFKTKKTHLTIY